MRTATRLAALLLSLFILATGCGGGDSDRAATGETEKPEPAAEVSDEPAAAGTPSREAIPDAVEPGTAEPGVVLIPCFDPEGKTTSRTAKVGDIVDLYICGQHPIEEMASATYRMIVPDGIEMLGETKIYPQSLAIGVYDQMFVITYPCHSGKELYPVIKYSLRMTDSYTGGEFRLVEAIHVSPFLGFVTCGDVSPRKVPAAGGVATLSPE